MENKCQLLQKKRREQRRGMKIERESKEVKMISLRANERVRNRNQVKRQMIKRVMVGERHLWSEGEGERRRKGAQHL